MLDYIAVELNSCRSMPVMRLPSSRTGKEGVSTFLTIVKTVRAENMSHHARDVPSTRADIKE